MVQQLPVTSPYPSYHFSPKIMKNTLTPQDDSDPDLQVTLRPLFIISNLFGIFPFPILGRRTKIQVLLNYLLKLYSLCVSGTISLLAVVTISEHFSGIFPKCETFSCTIQRFESFAFNFMTNFTCYYFFFKVGTFQRVVSRWNRVVHSLFKYNNDPAKGHRVAAESKTKPRITLLIIIYFGLVFIEHSLQDFWIISRFFKEKRNQNATLWQFIFNDTFPVTKALVQTSQGCYYWFYVGGKYKLLAWNFSDFLVMALGLCLCQNMKLFNNYFRDFIARPQTVEEWRKLRQMHLRLCEIVNEVDDFLSPATFCSVIITSYFICVQLYLQFEYVSFCTAHSPLLISKLRGTFLVFMNSLTKDFMASSFSNQTPKWTATFLYAVSSTTQLCFRVTGVVIIAGKLYEYVSVNSTYP